MNQDLQDKLIEKYPEQFKNLKWIEIDDGWYDLLDRLCYLIKNELDHKARINEPLKDFGWQQIKEKFGGMRIYVDYNLPANLDIFKSDNEEDEDKDTVSLRGTDTGIILTINDHYSLLLKLLAIITLMIRWKSYRINGIEI